MSARIDSSSVRCVLSVDEEADGGGERSFLRVAANSVLVSIHHLVG
jgi:hypothetical protein